MPVIETHRLQHGGEIPYQHQTYNALDCCLTFEIWEELQSLFNEPPAIYGFERALQGPALDIMSRGFLIDQYERQKGIKLLEERIARLDYLLQTMAKSVWDKPINPRSHLQLKDFFYHYMNIPEIWSSLKGIRALRMNRETLEKIDLYFHARPIVACIMEIRELEKKKTVLESDIDPDGRMRTSINVGATETGRFSSSTSTTGTGCVLPSTEVLTSIGWRRIDSIIDGDYIAQWSPNGNIDLVPCTIFKTEFSGDLLRIQSEQIIQTLTPQHRTVHYDARMRGPFVNSAEKASLYSQINIPLAGKYNGGENCYPSFLAALMADFEKLPSGWRGSFKKKRKQERFIELAEAANLDYWEEGEQSREGYRRFYIRGLTALPKKWGSWVLNTDRSSLTALVEEARHWDSWDAQNSKHRNGPGFTFWTADKEQAEWFATAVHLTGRSCSLGTMEQPQGSYSNTVMWSVHVKERTHAQIKRNHWEKMPYNGPVYCPQVPSSFWVMREKGKISITGNTNMFNITEELRGMFISDPGWKLCGIDLEQAESREVGLICGVTFDDWSYLDACEAGDLHTTVARMVWPELNWGDDPKKWRAIADQPFYRHWTYRDMSKRGGHGCLTEDHEVLTREGWVSITTKPSEIMTWNKYSSKFVSVSNWIDKKWSGTLVHAEGTSIDIVMTSDHKVVYTKDPGHRACNYHNAEAINFPARGAIPLGGNFEGSPSDITPAIARLIAAYQCDGHQKTTNRIEFHFHKYRKFIRLEELALDAEIEYYKLGDKAFLVASNWPKKAGSYLFQWSAEALDAYILEHRHWDGHIAGASVKLFSTDKDHLDWLQTMGRLLGYGGNFQKERISGFGSTVHSLMQNNRKFADIVSLETHKEEVENVSVYCPTVPSGYFYVRRNGRISVTGNSNYYGTPATMARHLKVAKSVMESFQSSYFKAFPGIQQWHQWTATEIQTTQQLTTVFGRNRHFYGRPGDDTTLREAIAYCPQSATADRLNIGFWRIWNHFGIRVQMLLQLYDAVYFQYREDDNEKEIIEDALRLISVPIWQKGRRFDVPGEAKIGWNWKTFDPKTNPDGLMKWKGKDERKRLTLLERPL